MIYHIRHSLFKASIISMLLLCVSTCCFSQNNPVNDTEAATLLQKISDRYKSYKNVSADFKLIIQRPKAKPEESDSKYTDTLKGNILLEGTKFHIQIRGQQIICDSKNIWTYMPADREVQVNYFEETDDMFSPSKIFSLYKAGYMYQIKEKKVSNKKQITVVEMAPSGKRLSYFKIDVSIDENLMQIVESKIYEKNGVRYIYQLSKQANNVTTTPDSFSFDAKKFPGVKVVDLR